MTHSAPPRKRVVKSAEEVREHFDRTGKTVTGWARQHGFKASLVYAVLDGNCKAKRGKGHNIAVLLGMKQGVVLTQGHGQ